VREFDAIYDAMGTRSSRPRFATTARLAPPWSGTTTSAWCHRPDAGRDRVPATQIVITRDPVSLNPLGTTSPNGTQHGTVFDGFDRPVQSTVTPPGVPPCVVGDPLRRLCAGGSSSSGRSVVQKVFSDPVICDGELGDRRTGNRVPR